MGCSSAVSGIVDTSRFLQILFVHHTMSVSAKPKNRCREYFPLQPPFAAFSEQRMEHVYTDAYDVPVHNVFAN